MADSCIRGLALIDLYSQTVLTVYRTPVMNRSCSVLLAVLVAQKKEVPVGLMVSGSGRGSSLVSRRLTSAHWQTPPTCRKQFFPIKFQVFSKSLVRIRVWWAQPGPG